MTTHCTYITAHPAQGYFYIGKSTCAKIISGYKGSGIKLQSFFKKYPKEEWETSVLWEFDTAEEAYSDEGGIITSSILKDPKCLNIVEGGRGITGYTHSVETKKKLRDGAPERARKRSITIKALDISIIKSRAAQGAATRKRKGTDLPGHWWNNGNDMCRGFESPGAEWVRGKLFATRDSSSRVGTRWWNDGVSELYGREAPGTDWKLGRLSAPRDKRNRFAKKDTL